MRHAQSLQALLKYISRNAYANAEMLRHLEETARHHRGFILLAPEEKCYESATYH